MNNRNRAKKHKLKRRSEYTQGTPVEKKRPGQFVHSAKFVRKKSKKKSKWVAKTYNHIADFQQAKSLALMEVYGQEFFRLIYGFSNTEQPKTRAFKNVTHESGRRTKSFGVLSKKIKNFRPLSSLDFGQQNDFAENIKNGTYEGLGEILVIALLLNDTDLRDENLGLDENNRFVKIDGDWIFAFLQKSDMTIPITEESLEHLGNAIDYPELNQFFKAGYFNQSFSITSDLEQDPRFRGEINRALLKILVLPQNLITAFLNHYSSPHSGINLNVSISLSSRIYDLRRAALKNKSFLAYLESETAKTDLANYKVYLQAFKTTKKTDLIPVQQTETIMASIDHEFQSLRQQEEKEEPIRIQANVQNFSFFARAQADESSSEKRSPQNSSDLMPKRFSPDGNTNDTSPLIPKVFSPDRKNIKDTSPLIPKRFSPDRKNIKDTSPLIPKVFSPDRPLTSGTRKKQNSKSPSAKTSSDKITDDRDQSASGDAITAEQIASIERSIKRKGK